MGRAVPPRKPSPEAERERQAAARQRRSAARRKRLTTPVEEQPLDCARKMGWIPSSAKG
jgi:hypothetical protein